MPYEVAIPGIKTALVAILNANAPLVSLLASKPTARGGGPAIYDEGDVPSGATFPYLTMSAWTQIGDHSFSPSGSSDDGAYGWNCTGQFKAIGQLSGQRNENTLLTLMSAVFAALPKGQNLSVAGYGSGWTDEFTLHPTIKETLAGVVTLHVPAILRVYVFDQ